MKYINLFKTHASYESEVNGGVDISLPNVSYCEDVKDVHYNPYNTVEFYVGEVTEPQTVSIYTDKTNHVDVTVSEGSKWYSYVLPKDKGLYKIEGSSVKKVVVKADINTNRETTIIPRSTVEASFKGSDTSKVTDMSGMFDYCYNLTSLDVSSFNTSKVTDMSGMFKYCSGLTSLDLSNFNTSKINSMGYMFSYCKGLISLDVSNFDTSNVTNMSYMFKGCSGLTSLTLSKFNTSNVTNMESMFDGCIGLTSLDVSKFDTSNVTNMSYMFSFCMRLTSLDLSGWDTSKVANMRGMFSGCNYLHEIKMVGCEQPTIDKIQAQLTENGINNVTIVTE